jgi:hypothetical protein
MKKNLFIATILIGLIFLCSGANAQIIKPKFSFKDSPGTHNMHIVSDGQYYYTCNGGRSNMGQISKFTFKGKLIATYKMELDMRSLMYNPGDKNFYVNTYERDIYRITDMENGKFEKINSHLYEDEQATLALSNNGKTLYYFSEGTLKIYDFPDCNLTRTISGLDCGSIWYNGSSSVAVDDSYIYTWNVENHSIMVYDMNGGKIKTVYINQGDYGLSLSCANGLVFVAKDGNYKVGHWYGYNLWAK